MICLTIVALLIYFTYLVDHFLCDIQMFRWIFFCSLCTHQAAIATGQIAMAVIGSMAQYFSGSIVRFGFYCVETRKKWSCTNNQGKQNW